MPKLDLTPYRGKWNMTPNDLVGATVRLISLSGETSRKVEQVRRMADEGRTSDAEPLIAEIGVLKDMIITGYVDCILSTMRNRVRSKRS